METANTCLNCEVFINCIEKHNKDSALLTINPKSLIENKKITPHIPLTYWCNTQPFVCNIKVNNAGYGLIVKVEDENINRCVIHPMKLTERELPFYTVESLEINMSKEEFEKNYCINSEITMDYYQENYVTQPCNCGQGDCKGWAAVNNNPLSIKAHNDLYR